MTTPDKKTIIPADPDDLICDTCPERFAYRGSIFVTFERARVAGWHIYQHVQMQYHSSTGNLVNLVDTRILCPVCIGTSRSRVPAPPVLEGQADILEDLGIEAQHVEKEKNPTKKGRAVN